MQGTHDHDPNGPRSRPTWLMRPGSSEMVDPRPSPVTDGPPGPGVAELTHELVREQLSDYLDDGLGESARRRIDGHLATCPPCAAYLHTLRVTTRGVQHLPAAKAPRGAAARIIEHARRQYGLTPSTQESQLQSEPGLVPAPIVRRADAQEFAAAPDLPLASAAAQGKHHAASRASNRDGDQALIGGEESGPPPLELAPAAIGAAILGGVLGGAYVGPLGAIVGTLAGGVIGHLLNSAASRFATVRHSH